MRRFFPRRGGVSHTDITDIDLKTAIRGGNVDDVIRILQQRNQNGDPTTDINVLGGDGPVENNAFLYTLKHCSPYVGYENPLSSNQAFRILEAILVTSDRAGNPIINLNVEIFSGSNAFEYLLNRYAEGKLTQPHARMLVDRMINCRNNRGDRILDLSRNGLTSPLTEAVKSGDEVIVESLLDLRNADGSFAIDPNYRTGFGKTALDTAITGAHFNFSPPGHRPNQRIVAMLRGRMEVADRVVVGEMGVVDNVLPPARQQPETEADVQAAQFNADRQNTHRPEVERTVDLSIDQLKKTYQAVPKPEFSAVVEAVKAVINRVRGSKVYTAAQIVDIERGLTFISRSTSNNLHVQSGLHLHDIITLIWIGIHDHERLPDGFPSGGDVSQVVASREMALLDSLKSIVTTYPGGGASCLGGTRNLIVSTLNHAHPDVNVAPTREAVEELAIAQMKRLMKEELLKCPVRRQRSILRAWEDAEIDPNLADEFKNSVKVTIKEKITSALGTVLEAAWLDQVFDIQYEYFPMPVVHEKLFQLLEIIREWPEISDDIKRIKTAANCVFNDCDRLFDYEYQILLGHYLEKAPVICEQLESHYRKEVLHEAERGLVELGERRCRDEISDKVGREGVDLYSALFEQLFVDVTEAELKGAISNLGCAHLHGMHAAERCALEREYGNELKSSYMQHMQQESHALDRLHCGWESLDRLISDTKSYIEKKATGKGKNSVKESGGKDLLSLLEEVRDFKIYGQKLYQEMVNLVAAKLEAKPAPDLFSASRFRRGGDLRCLYTRAKDLLSIIGGSSYLPRNDRHGTVRMGV